jgi:alpha-galactosidase
MFPGDFLMKPFYRMILNLQTIIRKTMKKYFGEYSIRHMMLFSILYILVSSAVFAKEDGLARTPPMGWNSWNAFQGNISEAKIKNAADLMVSSGMRDAGYIYLVLDDGWMAKERDLNGNLVGDPVKFPNGMKALGDYIHSKGLKFGIYECRGFLTCMKLPGSFNHEEQDMKTFASWGVDFIKLDGCYAERNGRLSSVELDLYSKSINRTGRPMILSISDFGNGSWAWGAKESAHMWRTSYDISPDIESVYSCANTTAGDDVIHPAFNGLWQFAGPSHWNDADMLQVGNLQNSKEDKIHFSLWCILASPLMAGNDLSSMSDSVRNILTAPEIIAVNQDKRGFQGYKVYQNGSLEIYNKPLSDGTTAVLLLNRGDSPADLTITWDKIGLKGKQKVRDLWERKDLGEFNNSFTASNLSKHEHMLIKVGTHGNKQIPGPAPVPVEKYTVTKSGTTWLSDLYYVMKYGDAPQYDANFNGGPISVNGTNYNKGLECRNSSRLMFRLNGKADRFTAIVGPDASSKGNETSRFRVLNEDFFGNQVLFDSGKIKADSSVKIDINVKGVEYLLLMFEGERTLGVWADAKVINEKN